MTTTYDGLDDFHELSDDERHVLVVEVLDHGGEVRRSDERRVAIVDVREAFGQQLETTTLCDGAVVQ